MTKGQQLFDGARASRLMREAGVDVILASRRHNVAYLTDGFGVVYWEYPDLAYCLDREDDGCEVPFYFAALPADEAAPPFAVAHSSRVGTLSSWVKDVKPCCDKPGQRTALDQVAQGLTERGLADKVIGVEMNHIPAGFFHELAARLPAAEFADAKPVFWKMRMVKTQAELQRVERAYRIAELIYEEIIRLLSAKPGVTTGELRAAEMAMAAEAGCPPPMFGYVFPQDGKSKLAWASGDPGVRAEKGDVVLLDLGLVYRGYTTDFGRNVSLGPASHARKEAYANALQLREAVAQAMKPGVRACDVYAIGADVSDRLSGGRPAGFGHALGIECHEPPHIMADDDTVLEEGMTIVIELGAAAEGVNFLIEDAGLLGPDGWRSLTRMSPELVELEV